MGREGPQERATARHGWGEIVSTQRGGRLLLKECSYREEAIAAQVGQKRSAGLGSLEEKQVVTEGYQGALT